MNHCQAFSNGSFKVKFEFAPQARRAALGTEHPESLTASNVPPAIVDLRCSMFHDHSGDHISNINHFGNRFHDLNITIFDRTIFTCLSIVSIV